MSDSTNGQSSDEEHVQLIDNFIQITGSDAERARDNLEWSMWDLAVALERYYGRTDMNDLLQEPAEDDVLPELFNVRSKSPLDKSSRKKKGEKAKFGTIADLKTTDTDSSDEEDSQAYYAGGSHSGQQILGPPSRKKKSDIIADILKSVQQVGAEIVDPTRPSSSTSRESFSGTGYRLGQTENDSQVIPSASNPSEEITIVTLRLWKEGFSVNDGPLREYDNPENKRYLDSVRRGYIPSDHANDIGNNPVQLNIEDHHHENFTRVRPQKIKPFSGQGHVLGRPVPSVIHNSSDEEQSHLGDISVESTFEVDQSQPITTIAIHLPDGSRLNGIFNFTHTIGDIRRFINQTHPEYALQPYSLQTRIPILELKDNNATIHEAELVNSVLIMKQRRW